MEYKPTTSQTIHLMENGYHLIDIWDNNLVCTLLLMACLLKLEASWKSLISFNRVYHNRQVLVLCYRRHLQT